MIPEKKLLKSRTKVFSVFSKNIYIFDAYPLKKVLFQSISSIAVKYKIASGE